MPYRPDSQCALVIHYSEACTNESVNAARKQFKRLSSDTFGYEIISQTRHVMRWGFNRTLISRKWYYKTLRRSGSSRHLGHALIPDVRVNKQNSAHGSRIHNATFRASRLAASILLCRPRPQWVRSLANRLQAIGPLAVCVLTAASNEPLSSPHGWWKKPVAKKGMRPQSPQTQRLYCTQCSTRAMQLFCCNPFRSRWSQTSSH